MCVCVCVCVFFIVIFVVVKFYRRLHGHLTEYVVFAL